MHTKIDKLLILLKGQQLNNEDLHKTLAKYFKLIESYKPTNNNSQWITK